MLKRAIIIILTSFFAYEACAHIIVHTSNELQEIISKDEEVGIVLLDGDWFQLEGVAVKMGGTIRPYKNRKPVLSGSLQSVELKSSSNVQNGYWTALVKGGGSVDYFFLDENYKAIKSAKKVDGKEFIYIKASDLQRTDKTTRSVRIKVPLGYSSLLNKNKNDFKNAKLKIAHWFVQMDIINLRSDDQYLYGQIDNVYNYNLLDVRPNATVQVSFFNFPVEDGSIFLDGKDVLHVPSDYTTAKVCYSDNIISLQSDRKLTIENITFVGAMKPIIIKGANKSIHNCSFNNCGSGVYCYNGVTNRKSNCSVSQCSFENLYNNDVITFVGCDDVLISNNFIHNAGMVNRGGSVIRVGGNNFKVEHNEIRCYSYIAINAGLTREYAAAKVSGIIKDNLIDNIENWGKADKQLTDGGGIYVLTHTDGVVIENNIVRNIGYEGCELWGIYLDDGAYNCTVRRNLVYNLWPGQYALTARYVDECERSCMNNIVENNILIGPCKIAGNRKGLGNKTIIRNNYITGDLITQGDEYVSPDGNKFISTIVGKDGRILSEKGSRIKKSGFTRNIKRLIKR